MRTALAVFGDEMWLYTAFRGVLTPRQAVDSANRTRGKPGTRPRRAGPSGLAPQGWPAGQLFSSSQATQCSYKFSELSIAFTITQVNIYRHPIKLIQGKQPFSPPILVVFATFCRATFDCAGPAAEVQRSYKAFPRPGEQPLYHDVTILTVPTALWSALKTPPLSAF